MLNNCLKSLLVVLILLYTSKNFAQNTDTFERGKPYILGDIDVQGKLNFNKPTVITFTGLEKGQKIILPGEEISTAIKKLAKLELFSDIDLYITNIKGDSIFLELYIVELPKLNEAKVRGVKKGKIEAILKDTDLKNLRNSNNLILSVNC